MEVFACLAGTDVRVAVEADRDETVRSLRDKAVRCLCLDTVSPVPALQLFVFQHTSNRCGWSVLRACWCPCLALCRQDRCCRVTQFDAQPLFPVHPSFLPVVPEESVDSLSLSAAPLLFAPSPHLFEIRTFSEECALNEEQPGSASLQLLGRVFLLIQRKEYYFAPCCFLASKPISQHHLTPALFGGSCGVCI